MITQRVKGAVKMEELLKQILSKISSMDERMGSMDKRLSSMEHNQIKTNNHLEKLDSQVVQILTDITEFKETANRIDNNVKYVKEASVNL
jgi:chromosome segregation ATPase